MKQKKKPWVPNRQLRRAREERGWTQEEVAKEIEVEPKSVSRWERGEQKPYHYYQRRLSTLFGKTIEELGFLDSREQVQERDAQRLHTEEEHLLWSDDIPARYEFFTDRDAPLQHLHETFFSDKTATTTYVLSGLGGIGKTLVALEYAYRYQQHYRAIFWVQADSPSSFTTGLLTIAQQLDLPEKRSKNPERVLNAVRQWMQETPDWLLILDNVTNGKFVRDQLPVKRKGHILITTQDQSLNGRFLHTKIDDLEQEQGALLLLRHTRFLPTHGEIDAVAADDQKTARFLSRIMEGLPLALAHAGAYIEATSCGLSGYQKLYEERTMEVLQWYDPARCYYPVAVAATWELAFEKVQEASAAAVDLLHFYAFLHAEAIPEQLILLGASELGPHLQHITDPLALNEPLAHLLRYSLIRRQPEEKVVRLHSLVQAVFKDKMKEEIKREWAERAIRAVNRTFQSIKQANLQEQDRYFPHMQACFASIQHWSFCFEEAVQLLLEMGHYAQSRMYYAQAEQYLQHAVVLGEKLYDSQDTNKALIYNNIASLYLNEAKHDLAERSFQKALIILQERHMPTERTLFAHVLSNLAVCEQNVGKLAEAEQHARKALDLIQQVPNVEDRDIAYCLNTLGGVYLHQNNIGEAERLSQQAFTLLEHTKDTEELDMARCLENLAVLRDPVPLDIIQRALAIYKQVYERDHPDIARCLTIIGKYYMEHQDYGQAKQYNLQALDIYTKTQAANHPDVIIILISLASCCLFLKQIAEARTYYKRVQGIAAKHPQAYPDLIEGLGRIFQRLGGRNKQ